MSFNKTFLYRKVFYIIFFLLFSCGEPQYNKTLKNYLNFIKDNDSKSAYELLSTSDKQIVPIEQYEINKLSDLSKAITHYMQFKILSSKISQTGRAAIVTVEIKKINLTLLYSLIPKLLDKNLNYTEIMKILHTNKKNVNKSYYTTTLNYTLVKENNQWKIVANYGEKKEVSFLLKEGKRLEENYKYQEALTQYKKILEYENTNSKAIDKIIEIQEKMDNINQIYLKYTTFITKTNEIKIKYKIINNLSLLISQVKVVVKFYLGKKVIKNTIVSIFDSTQNNNTKLGYKENKKGEFSIKDSPLKYDTIKCKIIAIEY